MKLTSKTNSLLAIAGLLLLGMPLAVILTMLLYPFWNWLEAVTGAEATGHSGPVGWCYVVVYAAMLLACSIGARMAIKRASMQLSSIDAAGTRPGAPRKSE